MINIIYVSLFSFVSFLSLDYLIKNNYLCQSIKKVHLNFIGLSYISIVFILSIIYFVILMLFSYFDVLLISFDNSLFEKDLFNFRSDSGGGYGYTGSGITNNINTNATVNTNHPNISVNLPVSNLNNLAGAVNIAVCVGLALKFMLQVPGGPGFKALAGGATILGSQALTIGMSKLLNSSNSGDGKTQNFIDCFVNLRSSYLEGVNNNKLNTISNLSDKYNDFPLNLLPEINQLATAELMFLVIILNIFIVKYITTIDYKKYIPNNTVGKILNFFINRYIILWSKSVKLLLIVS